ncbi:MAG: phage tail protein, partial [Prevotella sp.]|nr:phage tail protein [Prevotella sp.]
VGVTAAVPVALASICAALLYFPPFQNWAANKVASYASEKTGMEISVDKVRLEFPLKLGVEGVKVIKQNDSIPQQKDTVADIKKVVADVKMLPLFKKKVEIDQLDFHDAKINTTDFIDDTRVKGTIGKLSVKSHGIDLNTNEIRIDDAQIADAKVDVALSDTVPDDTTKTEVPWKIKVDNLNIERSDVQVTLPGDSLQMKAHLGKATVKDGNFDLKESSYQVGKLDIKDGRVQYDDKTKTHARSGFDSNHIDAKDVNLSMENISYKEPKLSANLKSASFKEKSGIDVRDVSGKLAMDDKKLTLKNATVKTPDSSISADFDMDMNTFDVKNAGKLNANIHAKIGKQDLMKYMGDTPAGFRKKWPNYPLSIDGVVKGNMDRLDFKGLNVKLPTAFQAKASGHAENLNDLKRLKADVNFDAKAHDVGFVQELLPNDLKKDIRIPKNISMKGNVKANGDKYSGNITMNEGGGNMKATFSYDNAKQSYTADVDANRLQLQHFAPNYGLSPFTG